MTVVASGEMVVTPNLAGFESKMSSTLGRIAKTSAVVFGASIAGAVGGVIAKGFGRLTQIEDAQASLKGLGHSTAAITTVMDNALASVKGTAFGLGDAATVAATTIAAGVKPGDELRRVLGLVGDAATIAKSSLGDMGSIFNKVAASNRVSMQEVNQLTDRGIPIMQWLAKEYGITAAAATDMVSDGKVDFAAFAKAFETNVAGAALKSGDTTRGAFANVGAAASRLGASLLGGVFPKLKAGFAGLITAIDDVTPAAERFGKKIGDLVTKYVGPFFEALFDGAARLVAAFKSEGFIGQMERFGGVLKGVYEEAVKPLASLVTATLTPVLAAALIVVAGLADAFLDVSEFVLRNSDEFKAIAGVIAVVLIPHYAAVAAAAVISAATQVASWVSVHVQAIASIVIHSANVAVAIAGWVAMAVAATANALVIAAAWVIALGPAGLLIAAIAAVAIGLVVAYNKSETFRNIAGPAVRYVKDQVEALVDNINTLISVLKKAIELAGKLNKLPGVGIAKKGLGALIPGVGLIPGFAEGGIVPGRLGAPMLAMVHGGERVTPPGAGGGVVFGPGSVVVTFAGNVSEAQAYTVGQAVGRGAAYEMERADARRAARVA